MEDSMNDFPDRQFLDNLAAATPVPAGGAAAAYCAACAAGLISMVTRITIEKNKQPYNLSVLSSILEKSENLRSFLTTSVNQDAKAYQNYLAVRKKLANQPLNSHEVQTELEAAVIKTIVIPQEIASKSLEVILLSQHLVSICLQKTVADIGSAVILAQSAIEICGLNIRSNLHLVQNSKIVHNTIEKIASVENVSLDLKILIEKLIEDRVHIQSFSNAQKGPSST
jgi:methenyltetrahydrofolate cyclohydrolase